MRVNGISIKRYGLLKNIRKKVEYHRKHLQCERRTGNILNFSNRFSKRHQEEILEWKNGLLVK